MGIESKNQPQGSIPKDFKLSNSAEVYNFIHMENGTKHHTPGPIVRVTTRFPTFL